MRRAPARGAHLRRPGCGPDGPTLEIFQYHPAAARNGAAAWRAPDQPGWGHIAFQVDSVALARQQVLEAGGGEVGEIVTLETDAGARVTWVYLTELEGNIRAQHRRASVVVGLIGSESVSFRPV